MKRRYTLLAALLLFVLGEVMGQTIYYATADGVGTGASPSDPASLQGAIDQAIMGDTIKVAAGTYRPTKMIPGDLYELGDLDVGYIPSVNEKTAKDNTFYIDKIIFLLGGYNANFTTRDIAANETILNGELEDGADNVYHVVVWNTSIDDALQGLIEGFTITGGKTVGNIGELVKVTDDQYINQNRGGGLYIGDGHVLISKNTIEKNGAGGEWNRGGGVFIDDNAIAYMDKNTITKNESSEVGGGVCNQGTLYMYQNTITENTAIKSTGDTGMGGGIYNFGRLYLYNNTIMGNLAWRGGGIRNQVNMYFGGNIIAGNKATDLGIDLYQSAGGAICESYGYNLIGEGGAVTNPGGTITIDATDATIPLSNLTATLNGAVDNGLFIPTLTNGVIMPLSTGEATLKKVPANRLSIWGFPTTDGNVYDQLGDLIPPTGTYNIGSVNSFMPAPPPPSTVYYAVGFTVDGGIILTPDAKMSAVEAGSNYTFYVEMPAGREAELPLVTINGTNVTMLPQRGGSGWVYMIPFISEDQNVVIRLNTVGNVSPDDTRLYSANGQLVVETTAPASVSVYGADGKAYVLQATTNGRGMYTLPKGIYIVKVNEKRYKTVVR